MDTKFTLVGEPVDFIQPEYLQSLVSQFQENASTVLVAVALAHHDSLGDFKLGVDGSIMPITHGDPSMSTEIGTLLTIDKTPPQTMFKVELEVQLIQDPNRPCEPRIPSRTRDTDAGYDLYSVEDKTIPAGRATLVHTGIRIAAPPGFYYTIEGRSSLWLIGVAPDRGIVDAGYTGEVVVSLVNNSEKPYEVKAGERIAQLILHRQYHAEFVEVAAFSPAYSTRGTKGFGSTGK